MTAPVFEAVTTAGDDGRPRLLIVRRGNVMPCVALSRPAKSQRTIFHYWLKFVRAPTV